MAAAVCGQTVLISAGAAFGSATMNGNFDWLRNGGGAGIRRRGTTVFAGTARWISCARCATRFVIGFTLVFEAVTLIRTKKMYFYFLS